MAQQSGKCNQSGVFDDGCDVVISSSEFIQGRLYFAVLKTQSKPKYTQNSHYFCIDDELVYDPFFDDFGPLNLAHLYRYCVKLNKKLKAYLLLMKKIVHYTSNDSQKCVNAAYLIGSYAIIYLNMTADEAYKRLTVCNSTFVEFRDASNGYPVYKISLLDCLNAVYKAHQYNFFNLEDFNLEEYEFYETVENGDLNWIVPNKFLAFAGPQSKSFASEKNLFRYPTHTPESYVDYFRDNNVTTIVRLNNKLYEASRFTKEGFTHKDLFFFDGSTPSDDLVESFLSLSEDTKGGVAVHCKAGLGRTGSMIACYIMKWYHFKAREAIAWLRICRPASIIGHQQEWLEEKEFEMWNLEPDVAPKRHKYGIYSIQVKLQDKSNKMVGGGVVSSCGGQTAFKQTKIKPTSRPRPVPVDNVTRIVNKVDSMSIENSEKDENKNCEFISNKDANKNNVLGQGDTLNQIKASRNIMNRTHTPKTVRTPWVINSIIGPRRTLSVGKITHQRRPLTRSKSSMTTTAKGILDESGRNTTKTPVGVTVPLQMGMTLRSNSRLYSLRHTRTPESRTCKTTSLR